MADAPTLGTSLSKTMQELTRIVEDCEDDDERQRALTQLRRTHRMLDVLVDQTVKKNAPEYEAATTALTQANDALVKARKEIATVAEAIQKVAKALGLVAKVAGAL
jgi:short-subunit dehydrogenase involved in D-alanine esterification of teichoic acids